MTPDSPQIRSIPTHELLEGLARLHPFVLVADRDGRIDWMSAKLRSKLHQDQSSSPLQGAPDDRLGDLLAHVPEPRQLNALYDDLRTNGRAGRVNLDIETEQGIQICVEASAFAMDSGRPDDPHYVVIARPTEDRARAERHLHATLGLLSQVVDRSPNGVIATDASGYVTYANPRAVALTGRRTLEGLIGSPIAKVLSTSTGFEDLLSTHPDPSDWEGEELETLDELGRSTWVSLSTRPLQSTDGRVEGVIIYLCEITSRREVQCELERKNQELEGYVDTVAHDLRSPLVSLLGFTKLLKQDYQHRLDDKANHFLDRVEQAGRTMDALIHDLLELSRIRKPGETQPLLDPRPVLLQVEAEFKLRLEERGATLSVPEAPPMMSVDGTRLYQIFSNLVGNALTHGFGAGTADCTEPRVSIEIIDDEEQQEIIVSDNGRGISREDQRRIFEVFQTGPGVRRGGRSHGIGLAIVKKIAEAHGGRAWVVSEVGQGTQFHISFPNRAR